ncbi:hypothetical protein B0H16DRAFT_1624955 [Mycena metata]|uniref:DUF427 domain-containing protein n=1 Tax=Mycena metata TaxID=1033252 RepID=A0AAD7H4Y8_9AGAR|nr:hypothetical protein B0H16DRAFT_1624955 [Mycena metata]
MSLLYKALPRPLTLLRTISSSKSITMKVTLNGTTLAESDKTVVVEGNHYFPPDSVTKEVFNDSNTSTVCRTASYYNASVGGNTVKDIAWYYPNALEKAKNIEGILDR